MELGLALLSKPAGDAVACIADARIFTFSELLRHCEFEVRRLRKRGVNAGTSVGLRASPTMEAVASLIALMEIKARVYMIAEHSTAHEMETLRRARPAIDFLDEPAPATPKSTYSDSGVFRALISTSGTTGTAKWASLPERALIAAARASESRLGWRDDDRWLLSLPLEHVGGFSIVVRCLLAGACFVVGPAKRTPFCPDKLAAAIEEHRVTLLSLVPAMLRRLLDEKPEWRPPRFLRAVLVGGAAADAALVSRARSRGFPVLTTYGMTETCAQIATLPLGESPRAGFVGPLLESVEVEIRAEQRIAVRGPMLFEGYDGLPPLAPNAWFLTGDRGHLDDSAWLKVFGRWDRIIVSGGHNIDPEEVESVLRSIAGVMDACVVSLPHSTYGEIVGCLLQLQPVPSMDLAAAIAALLQPAKRPRQLAICDELPRAPSGKIDTRAARDYLREHGRPIHYST